MIAYRALAVVGVAIAEILPDLIAIEIAEHHPRGDLTDVSPADVVAAHGAASVGLELRAIDQDATQCGAPVCAISRPGIG
jgi:hypothetical protein